MLLSIFIASLYFSSGFFITSLDLGLVQMPMAWVITTISNKSSGGQVSLCPEGANKLPSVVPISGGTYGFIHLYYTLNGDLIGFLSSYSGPGLCSPGCLYLQKGIM